MRELLRYRSLLFTALLVCGAAETGAYGQAAGAFARLGFGARGVAMSNALVADAFGQTSPYYNPAHAPFVARQRVEAAFALITHDRELQHLQFAVPLKPQAGVAAGLIHAGVSDIDGRDASGYHTENYSTDEFAFFFAFGLRFSSRVAAGLGLRLYRNDLFPDVDPVNSLGLSAGLNIRVMDNLFIGLAADDLLAKYEWDTSNAFGENGRKTTDRFPARLRLGTAYQLAGGRGVISVEYESLVEFGESVTGGVQLIGGLPVPVATTERLNVHSARFRLGGELWLAEPFAVRLGADRIGDGSAAGVTPSAGFTIEQALGQLGAQIDYAFMLEPYALGTMHLLSLRLNL